MIELLIEDERGNMITHQLGEGRHTLGKSADADIVLMDTFVSRYHADLFVTKSGVYIIDMESTNGIFFENKKINKTMKIEDGQSFNIGKLKLTTRLPQYRLFVREGRKPILEYKDSGSVPDVPAKSNTETKDENINDKVSRILMNR